jgi:hypothetical protein
MSHNPAPNPPSNADQPDATADRAVAACGGDVRGALGYARVPFAGQVPRDRKDGCHRWPPASTFQTNGKGALRPLSYGFAVDGNPGGWHA